jgi:hypothetical protein
MFDGRRWLEEFNRTFGSGIPVLIQVVDGQVIGHLTLEEHHKWDLQALIRLYLPPVNEQSVYPTVDIQLLQQLIHQPLWQPWRTQT